MFSRCPITVKIRLTRSMPRWKLCAKSSLTASRMRFDAVHGDADDDGGAL